MLLLQRKDVLFGGDLAAVDAGAQFAGEIIEYEHGLAFATVHGAGHMVPTFRPQAALQMIDRVVRNSSFAPVVPDIGSMSDGDFDSFLDGWVQNAKSSEFVRG